MRLRYWHGQRATPTARTSPAAEPGSSRDADIGGRVLSLCTLSSHGAIVVSSRQPIDPAALSGAALAAVLAIAMADGPFGPFDMTVGLTLLLVIYAYGHGARESPVQQLAFASVAAFCAYIMLGFPLERLFELTGQGTRDHTGSFITPGRALISWTAMFLFFAITEMLRGATMANAGEKPSTKDQATPPPAPVSGQRAKNLRESYDDTIRALHLLNGGGAVALLAFLGQVWSSEPLRKPLLGAIAVLVFGVVLTGTSTLVRVRDSLAAQHSGGRAISMSPLYHALLVAAFVCFIAALGWLLINLNEIASVQARQK